MQARGHCKIIQGQPGTEPNHQQPEPRNGKRQPENKKKINTGDDKTVQGWNIIEDIHLYPDKKYKPDDIFQQVTHVFFLFISSIFLWVALSSFSCSSC